MKKHIGIIVGVVLAISVFVAVILIADKHNHIRTFSYNDTMALVSSINYDGIEPNSIIPANAKNGNIADKIEGNENAKIIIYEYADYACSHCASANTIVNKIIKESDGKVAVVFRGFLINYFRNNVLASSAATAAQLQGYWQEYKDLLFENQSTWYYMGNSEAQDYFGELFKQASDNQGNLDQFYQDLSSDEVAKRVAFEYGLGDLIGIEGTPSFYVNGETVSPSDLKETIEKLLK